MVTLFLVGRLDGKPTDDGCNQLLWVGGEAHYDKWIARF